ncbi:uncharacterized protein LOC113377978 isoform X2 [Ctenocephalides felis]|uniref:uncharacterized protein LOC113377978 isoform X2 n=1 Tax=Ctenocephalides felis TaxID=7515 RepID=UPI000E6E4B14|nr:uncharacterized protein LOC113377978 isoform X2 [Ctenocephalides felis]
MMLNKKVDKKVDKKASKSAMKKAEKKGKLKWQKTYLKQGVKCQEKEHRAVVLKKLQDSIQHKDSNITAGRRLSVEKWVKTYIEQKQLESYKSGFSSEEVDDDGKPATNNRKYVRNELLDAMKSVDPVFTFWIDKKTGGFEKHDDAAEGFNKAVEFKWSEGVEYFYRRMSQE